jgi:hypothetical protein
MLKSHGYVVNTSYIIVFLKFFNLICSLVFLYTFATKLVLEQIISK